MSETCIQWGPLKGRVHASCFVVATDEVVRRDPPAVPIKGKLPQVCSCGCYACKRAWRADGRPLVRDGKIVRAAPTGTSGSAASRGASAVAKDAGASPAAAAKIVKSLAVTLVDGTKGDEAARIADAIRMIRGVRTVAPGRKR